MHFSLSMRERLPAWREMLNLFLLSVFPLQAWATLIFFHQLPSYLLKMSIWSALEIFAYSLVFVLIECLLVTGVLLLGYLALPYLYSRDRWVVQSAIIFLALIAAFLPIQFRAIIQEEIPWFNSVFSIFMIGWLVVTFSIMIVFTVRLRRSQKFAAKITNFFERMSILSIGYLAVDVLCVLVILLRNLT